MATLEVLPRREATGPANWLMAKARDVHSQFGEDGVLEALLSKLDPPNHYCIEFGAWDGKFLSNCWRLIEEEGWNALLIEGNSIKFFDLLANIEGRAGVQAAHAMIELEGPKSIDSLAREAGAPEDPALLSIDVDGMDFHIWRSITRLKPHVLVIEFNPTFPNNVVFIQDPQPNCNHGSSARALVMLAAEKGMALAAATTTNLIFVREEALEGLELETNALDDLVDSGRHETVLAELYDGTLLACGRTRMMWHRRDFGPLGLQALPPEERHYPDASPKPASTWRGATELPYVVKRRPGGGRPTAVLIANALRPIDDLIASGHALYRRFDVVMVELRGGPAMRDAAGPYRPDDLLADLQQVLAAAGVGPALMIGHGVGALLAAALLEHFDEALGCVCLDPPVRGADSPFYAEMLQNPRAGAAGPRLAAEFFTFGAIGGPADGEAGGADFGPLFRALDKPCVVLAASAADRDLPEHPPVIADATLEELAANPHLRAHRLPEIDHLDAADLACVGVELLGAALPSTGAAEDRKSA